MRAFFILLVLFQVWTPTSAGAKETLRIATASNFKTALDSLVKEFSALNPVEVLISSGSSGKFVAQIQNGAPFDVFLSADEHYPEILIEKKLAEKNSAFTYAVGSLVLWSPKDQMNVQENLKNLKFNHLAIANTVHAPYGKAAKETLEHLELWQKAESKIVMGENAEQAFQFVNTGNADLGLIPYSITKNQKGSHWKIPHKLHSPIRQNAVLLSHAKINPAAKQFLEFLKNKKTKLIIQSFGYEVP